MKRSLRVEEQRLWAHLTASVRPVAGRAENGSRSSQDRPETPSRAAFAAAIGAGPLPDPLGPSRSIPEPARPLGAASPAGAPSAAPLKGAPPHGRPRPDGGLSVPEPRRVPARAPRTVNPPEPQPMEPLRRRRLVRERDPIDSRLDLHGLDQDRARAALFSFLKRAHHAGFRTVLVITGKGALGDGVLRRRVPEWLTEGEVRPLIAGVAQADRRHGGAGALYLALKRRSA